jgi:hypothetical protein
MMGAVAWLALLVVSSPVADTVDVTGAWTVRWAQAVRVNADLSVEIQGWGVADLVLDQQGDRVRGTWTTEVVERVTWTVEGSIEGDRLELRSVESDSDNSELAMAESITWRATVSGEQMEGIVLLGIRGRDRPPAERPFSGCRTGC